MSIMTGSTASGDTGTPLERAQYRVTGMDCAHDAAEIEAAVRSVPGVDVVRVSVATQVMTTEASHDALPSVEQAVRDVGYQLDRIEVGQSGVGGTAKPPAVAPAYRRALWIVVVLNAGYGVIEAVGGFVSDSQALKADALDFLGDGFISLLGLSALSWQLRRRAQAALLQGWFLAALGFGVIVHTAYRVLIREQPEAELMGAFALVALAVNVSAAVVLLPHRTGDANTRAIWLFSRNDALGNLAVVLAAGLVAWTASPWPDLLVAFMIAGLFLQSASSIVRDAHRELVVLSVSEATRR